MSDTILSNFFQEVSYILSLTGCEVKRENDSIVNPKNYYYSWRIVVRRFATHGGNKYVVNKIAVSTEKAKCRLLSGGFDSHLLPQSKSLFDMMVTKEDEE